jgi:hypothetical protein
MVHMLIVEPTADYPLPFDLSDEEPKTHADSVAIAVNTIDLLEELGESIDYTDADLAAAKDLITGAEKPNTPRTISVSAQAKAAQVLIKEFDFQAFADIHQARNFITNKLVSLADCGDTRIEIKALELLGKHSDIGLFTERSEITIKHTTAEALEKSIKERVKRLLNADVTDITPIDDLDAQLGSENEETITQDAELKGD